MKNLAQWSAQLACVALGVLSTRAVLVERSRSINTPMPRATVHDSPEKKLEGSAVRRSSGAVSEAADTWGVSLRLIDHLGDAEIDVPDFAEPRIAGMLKGYWRRVRAPFAVPAGDRGRLVQHVGIASVKPPTTSPEPSVASDGRWHADPRLWGLDGGTYDQRESIVAPAPSRLKWRVTLPEKSQLQTSLATFAGEGTSQFEISIISGGERHVLFQKRLRQSRAWEDVAVDLSTFRGDVTLELLTTGSEAPLAAWGSPVIMAPGASSLPYNVVFIVVDAMRADALASTHDPDQDARLRRVPLAPFDAWLPAMPDVAPNLDRLASDGTTFVRAWSAAMWTRPSTLAMLTGMRAARLGLPVLELEPRPSEVRAFYSKKPPLWPLLMRAHGAVTRAIVNNMYLCGYVGVGVDAGFEAITDHRYRASDTEKITTDTISWLRAHSRERFSLFLNYVSPHAPYVPESKYLAPIERALPRPDNRVVRRYLGEIRKDDAAIGRVLDEIRRLGLLSNTIFVVTADHGETLSEAHDWVAVDVAKDVHSGRFTHLSTMWEEAARVPLILALPGVIPAKRQVMQPVQTTDILPTLLDILGIEIPKEIDGVSLRPLWSDTPVPDRQAVIEGRGAVSIIDGRWHYIQRSPIARHLKLGDVDVDKATELYDLDNDPGERKDVSAEYPAETSRLKRDLQARLASRATGENNSVQSRAKIHLRISTGQRAGELVGDITIAGGRIAAASPSKLLSIQKRTDDSVHVTGQLPAGAIADLELHFEPASANLDWVWHYAGAQWPKVAYHVGPLGLVRDMSKGVRAEDTRVMLANQSPYVVSSREQGIFVTRDTDSDVETTTISQAAQAEAQQAMQAWGYVRKPEASPKPR